MQLPLSLRNAIEQEAARAGLGALAKAAAALSERYRMQACAGDGFMTSEIDRLAYLAVRMPATFAAAYAVLAEVRRLTPQWSIESLLDLGAGTGAAGWAASELLPGLRQCTAIEQDRELIELGRRLVQSSESPALRSAGWQQCSLQAADSFPPHDLVICSYSLGEVGERYTGKILNAAWQAARCCLIVIEPGTRGGFEVIRSARGTLTKFGGHIIAPCPHRNLCPMPEDDWCHFSQRVERSSLHRRIKGAGLGYEDEKYSYVAFAKDAVRGTRARVLRHPLRHSGFIELRLCAEEGLAGLTITRREGEAWKLARKTDWGDEWELLRSSR